MSEAELEEFNELIGALRQVSPMSVNPRNGSLAPRGDCSEQHPSFSERRRTRDDHHHLPVMCASIAFPNKGCLRISYEDEGCIVFWTKLDSPASP